MNILYNECLKKYTTVKIGGYAKKVYIPENTGELIDIFNSIPENERYIIGRGSNILINDDRTYENVISLSEFDNSITKLDEGKYYVGASVKLQKLIKHINNDGFGGIEYLYSVPGLLGGAIVMNAGRGKLSGLCISDHIIDIHVYTQGTIKILKKEQCEFQYRSSIFKNNRYLILGATFTFNKMSIGDSKKLKDERLELCKSVQDNSGYNFGSVFMESDWRIMRLVKIFHPGYKKGVSFSKKNGNWIINRGEGTFNQAMSLIKTVQKIHRILGKKALLEVILWK